MNMTEGCISLATENNARTSFSPSPTCKQNISLINLSTNFRPTIASRLPTSAIDRLERLICDHDVIYASSWTVT